MYIWLSGNKSDNFTTDSPLIIFVETATADNEDTEVVEQEDSEIIPATQPSQVSLNIYTLWVMKYTKFAKINTHIYMYYENMGSSPNDYSYVCVIWLGIGILCIQAHHVDDWLKFWNEAYACNISLDMIFDFSFYITMRQMLIELLSFISCLVWSNLIFSLNQPLIVPW